MKTVLSVLFFAAVCAAGVLANSLVQNAGKGAEGIWAGKLDVGGVSLRLVVKINKKPDGKLAATLDSLDQGAKDIPIDTVALKEKSLRLELKAIGGVYEGKLNADETEVTGTWTQGGNALPLNLKRTDKAPEVRRPQVPKKPYPYNEEEVSYENKSAKVTLAGTFTFPKGAGPFPAVLLITGSGPQDRDEALLGHQPFLVLSDYLTRQGIAVLRVDDRGVGKSTGDFAKATTQDFATDVLAGVAYLKTRKEVNPKQIGLIGHSEGGVIAPIVATKSPDVAFIVMMAGTGLPGDQILYLQGALIMKANGAPEAAIKVERESQEKMFAVLEKETDSATTEAKLMTILQESLAKLPEAQRKAAEPQAVAQIKSLNGPWFRYFLTYDPRPTLRKVTCPVLAINGEKDLQVPPKENLPEIEAALKAGGNKDFTIKELPGLNHLFQSAKTGSPSEYNEIEETIAPVALKTMADWILAHTTGK